MENKVLEEASNGDAAAVPNIVITEPSPVIQNTSVVSIAQNAESDPTVSDVTVDTSHSVQNGAIPTASQASPSLDPGANSSGEFTSAQECGACVVSVPEPSGSQAVQEASTATPEDTPATSEVDNDDFRTTSSTGCCAIGLACLSLYDRIWEILDQRFRLPFWLILMAVPLSAGIMGSLYMYSCPAAETLASAVFSTGISLMAVLSIRTCIALHRMTTVDSEFRHALQTLLLIATFVTAVFFGTESVLFWQMDSTSQPGSDKYCDPTFSRYAFWFNCLMWVLWVPLLVFPC